jgi:hypothetical protein
VKTLRVDATDAQMKVQAELVRISAQRAQSALCSLYFCDKSSTIEEE